MAAKQKNELEKFRRGGGWSCEGKSVGHQGVKRKQGKPHRRKFFRAAKVRPWRPGPSPLPGRPCDMSARVMRVALHPLSTHPHTYRARQRASRRQGMSPAFCLQRRQPTHVLSVCFFPVSQRNLFLILDGTQSRERRALHKQRTAIMRMGLSLCPWLVCPRLVWPGSMLAAACQVRHFQTRAGRAGSAPLSTAASVHDAR